MEEKRVADYFIISGVSENAEHNTESKPLINSVLPITDITVIIKGLGEQCPIGYTCIEYTPGGHIADLNNGNFKSPNIHICYRRGNDKPPLVEVGVYHQDKDRVLPDVEVVHETPYGRSASTGNSTHKSGTFITYRRAKTKSPYNQLVVVDLCVILNNKSEHPPHAFYSIKKNLNKSYYGMIGSEVFLCYKKTLLSPPSICYTPQIISRFPLQDLPNFPLPDTVPLFCLPAGASIESRPSNLPLPKPIASTFVLTSDSAQKIYGSSLSFYEPYDELLLTQEQRARLSVSQNDDETEQKNQYETYAIKSICILSRWPFFECFEKFLVFLHKLVFNPYYSPGRANSPTHKSNIPLEHHISHFLLDVSFPTSQRPTVIVQLMPGTDETITISQPSSKLPLPLTGASFIHLLSTLGVENTMNVLLFGLCEQKILLHSLNPWLLTSVAEAITAILFPFHWQCPYVPLCPLSLHGILNAPLPFIVGIDSRCFDTFTPPDDVICVDLDTRSIFLSELKKCLNIRILPKRAARVLRNSLDDIFQKWMRVSQAIGANQSPQHKTPTMEASRQQLKRRFELEIQEAFVRFMATILKGFRSYLLPITRAPTVGATDPTSLFDFEGFLMSRERNYSQFYLLITKTQLFTHYIEERSFVSDKDTSLAFFDDCEEKLSTSDDVFSGKPIKLFDKDDEIIRTDRSVYIPAPEQSPSVSHNNSVTDSEQQEINLRRLKFGPLNPALFHRHPQSDTFPSLDKALKLEQAKNQSIFDDATKAPSNSFSISRRTKQEVEASHRWARKSAKTPSEWSKYLVSCCYCLWFSLLPSYIAYCKHITLEKEGSSSDLQPDQDKTTARILRYAYSAIVRMQRVHLTTDEVCFRILTLLCGHCGQPALAVRVFLEMRRAGIKPNAITYGYYNTALLESKWPDHSGKPTTVLWTKIKNVIMGIALFKFHGRIRMSRRDKCSIPLIGGGDISFGHIGVVGRASTPKVCDEDLFRPTTVPIDRELDMDCEINKKLMNKHRRSLVDRSFSTFQKSTMEVDKLNNMPSANTQNGRRAGIRKSNSMHVRSVSPETGLLSRSSSFGDDDQHREIARKQDVYGKESSLTQETLSTVNEKQQLLSQQSGTQQAVTEFVSLISSTSPGQALTTELDSSRKLCRSASQSFLTQDMINNKVKLNGRGSSYNDKPEKDNESTTDCFDEGDLQCIADMDTLSDRKPKLSHSVNYLRADDASSEGTRSNRLSESVTDTSMSNPSNDIDFNSIDDVFSTPNFKLSSLINDASNLQWSKWTSSQNSKSVYKGIKSVATGLVSSLQEIKSSFSISNSTTPAKFITTAQQKSTTREMLSQWATQWGYFLSQTTKEDEDDSDGDSVTSGDLLNLVDDENIEQTSAETNDFQFYHRILIESERQYNTTNSIEDLVCHLSTFENVDEDQIAIVIKLTTCNRCSGCHSLLNDEEIMGRWSYNESNLNTRCVYCQAKIVPQMTVEIEDRRVCVTPGPEEFTATITQDLLNLDCEDDQVEGNNKQQEYNQPSQEDSKKTEVMQKNHTGWHRQTFTVPYLSPIVLRKELESVFESSGDSCPASCHFIDEHPIIFWNLLWYFSRIGIPTHLALLCLTSKSVLNGKESPTVTSLRNKVIVQTLLDGE